MTDPNFAQTVVLTLVPALIVAYLLVLVFGMDGALARHFYQAPDRDARIRMELMPRIMGSPIG
ncbi:MAG: hypothetical protein HC774_02290 [Sphingomonadales bacterium]|nr:hypothetical protein [Sphingomonadales bacterium]